MPTAAWRFHLLVVPAAAIVAAVVAATAPKGTVVFAVSFLVVAGFIATIPIIRIRLDNMAVKIGRPELFSPAMGVPTHELQLRGFHVLLFSMYGTIAIVRPDNALSTVLLFIDTTLSVFVYVSNMHATTHTGSPRVLAATEEAGGKPESDSKCAWLHSWTRQL